MLRATRPATLVARQARLYSTKAEQTLGNEFTAERAATAAHAKRAYRESTLLQPTMSTAHLASGTFACRRGEPTSETLRRLNMH